MTKLVTKADVRITTLDTIMNVLEHAAGDILNKYKNGSRQQQWAVDELNHVLKHLSKWSTTVEARAARGEQV